MVITESEKYKTRKFWNNKSTLLLILWSGFVQPSLDTVALLAPSYSECGHGSVLAIGSSSSEMNKSSGSAGLPGCVGMRFLRHETSSDSWGTKDWMGTEGKAHNSASPPSRKYLHQKGPQPAQRIISFSPSVHNCLSFIAKGSTRNTWD